MSIETSILIVDDDPNFRKTLSGILRARDYAPVGVATGKAALNKVEEEIPAVALIDLMLEDMSGLEVMKEVKERSPGTECIVLTGYASQESAIEAVNLGAYSYLQKPYDMEQLLVTVRRAVEKREAAEALRESEERLHTVVSNAPVVLFTLDREGVFTFSEGKGLDDLGLKPGEVVGQSVSDVYRDVSQILENIHRTLAGETFTSVVEVGELAFETRYSPLRDQNGEVVGVIGIAADITERKRAEEEIRQRTAQLEALREVGLKLTAQLDLDTLLHSIASQAVELLGGAAGGLDIYRPERDVLEWTASIGRDPVPDEIVLHRGEGLSGKVWETGELLIVDDYHHWEGRAVGFEDYFFTAVVGVPVRWGDEFLGVLEVMAEPPRAFSPADAELLSLFATQAAIAIRNARLYEQVQARSHYLETLQRINSTLRNTLPLDQVLGTIARGAGEALNYVGSLVLVPDAAGEKLTMGAVWGGRFLDAALRFTGIELDVFGLSLAAQENPITQAYLSGELQISSGEPERIVIGVEPAISPKLAPLIERAMGAKLAACVPLPVGDRIVGVLIVFSPRPQLLDEERAMLIGMADQAGLAIENARLYEETRSRAERLAAVNHIARAAGAILDLDDLLETVYQEITSVFQADAFFMALYDEEANELDFRIQVDEGVRELPGRQPLEAGLTSLIVTEKKPLLIRDLEQERDRLPSPELYGTMKLPASWLGVPMQIGEQLIGVISVQAYRPHAYGEEEELLLSTIADQVAVAIEQARLYQSEREQRELAEALEGAAAAVSSTLETDQVLDRILEQVERVVAGDAFNIMLIEAGTARVVRSRGYERLGMEERIARFVAPVAELSTLVQMVQAEAPVVIPDTFTDPAWVLWEGWERLRSFVGVPIRVSGVTVGILNVDGTRPGQFGPADAHRLAAFADHAAAAVENARLFEQAQQEIAERKRVEEELQQSVEQLRKAFEGTVEVLVSTIEIRDPYTAGHQRRVTQLACAIASEMGLPQEQIRGIHMAGLVHDLGKINIPAEILSKPSTLSDLEYGLIKMHVQAGYDVLKGFDFPWPVAQIVLQHHERMDGSGYPQGLSGEEILLEARILAVADVVTAMASHRPYRAALGIDKALEEISQNRGVLYDAEMADVCLKLFTEKGFEFE